MITKVFTPEELGERWHISTETLRYWRWNATGPDFVKFNGCVLYRWDNIDEFEKAHLRRHTAADHMLVNGKEGKVR
jgi:hypothetical protein